MAGDSSLRPRVYDDPCGVARALNVVGERWALLVVRELLFGAKRYSSLRRGLPGISPNVLSQRLTDLEDGGVLSRRRLGPPANATVYQLTEYGQQLLPVLRELGGWGARGPLRSDRQLSVDSLVLALHTSVDPARPPLQGVFALRFGDDTVSVRADGHTVEATRSTAEPPTATITTDTETLRHVVFGVRDADEAVAAGALVIDGDAGAGRRFLTMFR